MGLLTVVFHGAVRALVLLRHAGLEGLVDDPHVLVDVGVLLATQLAHGAGPQVDHLVVHGVVGEPVGGVATDLALVAWRLLAPHCFLRVAHGHVSFQVTGPLATHPTALPRLSSLLCFITIHEVL